MLCPAEGCDIKGDKVRWGPAGRRDEVLCPAEGSRDLLWAGEMSCGEVRSSGVMCSAVLWRHAV